MNQEKFDEVIRALRAAFERVDRRLREAGENGGDVDVIRSWFEVIGNLDGGSCLDVIRDMTREGYAPRAVEGYIHRIREKAKAERDRMVFVDGEPTYRCAECFDSGLISVFLFGSILDRRLKQLGPAHEYAVRTESVCVGCWRCEKGRPIEPKFNPSRMDKWSYEKLRERFKQYPAPAKIVIDPKPMGPDVRRVVSNVGAAYRVSQGIDPEAAPVSAVADDVPAF